MDINAEPLLNILEDKTSVLTFLTKEGPRQQKYANGLRGMKSAGFSQEGMLEKLIEVAAQQSEAISRMSALLLVYTQSSTFDQDLTRLLTKLGYGADALSIMMNNRIKHSR